MGQPVVHFEIIGKDTETLQSYYSDLFGWEIDSDNPMNYGIVQRDGNFNADGVGIGGGVGAASEGYAGHVTFYIEGRRVPTARRAPPQAGPFSCARRLRPISGRVSSAGRADRSPQCPPRPRAAAANPSILGAR